MLPNSVPGCSIALCWCPRALTRSISGLPAATRLPDGPRRIWSREASPETPGTPSDGDISAVHGRNRLKFGVVLHEVRVAAAAQLDCDLEVLAGTGPDAASDTGVTRARRIWRSRVPGGVWLAILFSRPAFFPPLLSLHFPPSPFPPFLLFLSFFLIFIFFCGGKIFGASEVDGRASGPVT